MKSIANCLACDSHNLHPVLDLENQPLANSYLNAQDQDEKTYPLSLNYCENCSHLQLRHAVDPSELFENYLYVSGTSQTLNQYFQDFVELTKRYGDGKRVLDIACNDGTQLNYFKQQGYDTYGIDPARNLHELSSQNHNVICDYLNQDNMDSFGVEFDVITAQNVLAHNSYPAEFLKICKSKLAHRGRIFIQTSQADMIDNNEFDTIYHEHISFFTVHSFVSLIRRVGLKLIDLQKTPVHGNSFVFVLSNDSEDQDRSSEFLDRYKKYTIEDIKVYAQRAKTVVENLKTCLSDFQNQGYSLVGFGAAAKGNTLLNFGQIKLDYIVDDNPLKQGLYTPGQHIPIVHPDQLLNKNNLLVVPLAWNFYQEIKHKVLSRNSTAKFVRYFPEIFVE
jgi:SAM-dependent methyltransferase